MPTTDPRVDAYIAKSAAFAQPILQHLRAVVHAACPQVEETIKWGFPHFMYQGIVCSMASFKAHCTLNFWKGSLVVGDGDATAEPAMGQFGRITAIADLPSAQVLTAYIERAMQLNAEGVKTPQRARPATPRAPAAVPHYLAAALLLQPAARTHFEHLSPSQQREYIEWLEEAKTDATRQRRLAQAVEWIAEGKTRNWKYAKC